MKPSCWLLLPHRHRLSVLWQCRWWHWPTSRLTETERGRLFVWHAKPRHRGGRWGRHPCTQFVQCSGEGFHSVCMYSLRAVGLLAARADLSPRSHRPVEARKHRAPAVKFGTSGRGSLTTSASPGPQYSAESGIGKQQLSRHKSSGSVKFTTAKRFVEKEVVTPGPDAYSGDGGAVLSRNRSTPAFTMGAR